MNSRRKADIGPAAKAARSAALQDAGALPWRRQISSGRGVRRAAPLWIACLVAAAWSATTNAAQTLGLHTALEVRAGYADENSRWRDGDDASLFDVAGTLRPLWSAQRDDLKLTAELEITATTGDTLERADVVALTGSNPENDLFDASHVWSTGERHRNEARLDRLALTWTPAWGTVTAGRHAVTWGGGLVFNPFDLFNPFAPGDVIRDYKVGADMLHVDVPLADGGFQLLAVGRRSPVSGRAATDASSFAALWQRRIGSREVALMSAWHYDEPVLGVGIAGLLGDASWRIDGTWLRVRPPGFSTTEDYIALVANLQYSWIWANRNVFGFLEYHHNSLGHSAVASGFSDPYLLTQIARQNVFLLGRDYAAASLQVELHPLVNAFVSVIANLRDPSVLLQPRVVWNASNRMQVTAGLDLPIGARGTEFGGFDPGDSLGTTRAPRSAYVRATWDW